MGLTKQAHGLPRFMMDCGWWRNGRRWRRPTLAEIGLHHAAVSFSNEHGTDGIVPGPAEDLAVALSLPVKDVKRTVPLLIARAVWVLHEDGDYEILGFLDHNPSRHEVNRDRQQRVDKAERANHQRWHVKGGQTDPDCPYCKPAEASPQDSLGDSSEESSDESCADSISNGRKEWKERLDGTEGTLPPPVSEEPSAATQHEEEDKPPPWAFIEAERRLRDRKATDPVNDPEDWVTKTAWKLWMRHAADVLVWQADDPELTNWAIAARLAPAAPESEADRIRRIAHGISA